MPAGPQGDMIRAFPAGGRMRRLKVRSRDHCGVATVLGDSRAVGRPARMSCRVCLRNTTPWGKGNGRT